MAHTIHELLKTTLARSGLSQAEMARRVNRDPATIAHIIKGDDRPSAEVIEGWMSATDRVLTSLPTKAAGLADALERLDTPTAELFAHAAEMAASGDPYLLGEVRGTLRAMLLAGAKGASVA